MLVKKCGQCKKEFITQACLIKIGKGRFCSRPCVREAKADRIAITDPVIRFWRMVDKNDPSGCWIWKGSKDKLGYGSFNSGVGTIFAHRFAENLKSPLPKGQPVMHLCDNPSCVLHIKRGTALENVRDCVLKGRIARGSKHGMSILKEKDIYKIRKLIAKGIHQKVIAKMFKVCGSTINDIHKKRNWSWLT